MKNKQKIYRQQYTVMLETNKVTLFLCVIALLLSSEFASGQTKTVSETETINLRFNQMQEAIRHQDTTTLGDIYCDSAVSLLQKRSVQRGRETILARWKRNFTVPIAFHLMSLELNLSSGNREAYQFGTFELLSTDSSASLIASGKWLFLWKKEVDRWRISLEMDNFDSPKAPNSK